MADINQGAAPKTSSNGNANLNPAGGGNSTVEVTDHQEELGSNLSEFDRLFGVGEDAYEQPTTTRKELWSYYLYYNGNRPGVITAGFH